jgi:hypothetical protein
MCRLTKFVLAWLLMLAIPMKGFAATAMLFSAPSHHSVVSTSSASQVAAPTLQASAHHHADMQQSTHHEYESDVSSSTTSAASDSLDLTKTAPLKIGKLADGKCSACATCCTGSTVLMNSVAMTGSDSIPFALESFVSYVPEGFDPPPRSILA